MMNPVVVEGHQEEVGFGVDLEGEEGEVGVGKGVEVGEGAAEADRRLEVEEVGRAGGEEREARRRSGEPSKWLVWLDSRVSVSICCAWRYTEKLDLRMLYVICSGRPTGFLDHSFRSSARTSYPDSASKTTHHVDWHPFQRMHMLRIQFMPLML